MSFEITTSSFRLERRRRSASAEATNAGLLAGAAGVFFCLVGAYVEMDKRFIVDDWLTLSQAMLLGIGLVAGANAALAGEKSGHRAASLLYGALAGLAYGLVMAAFLLLIRQVDLRAYFVGASPALARAISLAGLDTFASYAILVVFGLVSGMLGVLVVTPAAGVRTAIIRGMMTVALTGLFRDVFADILDNIGLRPVQRALFGQQGIALWAAVAVGLATAGISYLGLPLGRQRLDRIWSRRVSIGALAVVMIALPLVASSFIAQVLVLVALFALMGMGLHIELGLAGLVDLGFVAFYAVGAYTVALLCSTSPTAMANLSFWVALPIAVLLACATGFIFGLPVLRVRGDYLALATLGLGEIIRVLVVSDFTAPLLGGPQGIIGVQRPELFGQEMSSPIAFYSLALGLALVAGFIASRLQASKVGRAWLAVREDEDVAQALGVDLVAVKLLAYTVGAGFAGASGAVFAILIGAVYPHSFQLLISVNLLAILVIGGLGSLPGVLVGSLVLIGLPELMREFGDFRYLFYGIALVAMVRLRPEGLWPATRAGLVHG